LKTLGYVLSPADLDDAFKRFKILCDRKKTISDSDLEALVGEELTKSQEFFKLENMQVTAGFPAMPMASVTLRGLDQQSHSAAAAGDGPVDSVYQAINQIVGPALSGLHLSDFSIHAVTPGEDALGRVVEEVRDVKELSRFVAKRLHQPRVLMAERIDSDPAEQVPVRFPLRVDQFRAPSAARMKRRAGVGRQQECALPRLNGVGRFVMQQQGVCLLCAGPARPDGCRGRR